MSESRETRFKARAQREATQRKRIERERDALLEKLREYESQPNLEQVGAMADQLRAALHRQEFDKAASAAGVSPDLLDDLWKIAPPDMDADEPDPKAIAKHVRNAVKDRPWALAKSDADDDQGDDERDDTDDDQGDDEREADSRGVFDLAKPIKGKSQDTGKSKDSGKSKGDPPKLKAQDTGGGKLTRGEGSGRGSRDDHRARTLAQIVDDEFAETGRTDPFRI